MQHGVICKCCHSVLYTGNIFCTAEMKDIHRVSLEPTSCICPSQNYICQADGVKRMQWESDLFLVSDPIDYSLLDSEERSKTDLEIEQGGVVQVKFTRSIVVGGVANISSTLLITNLTALNGTNITCEVSAGVHKNDESTSIISVIGKRYYVNVQ